MAKPVYQEIMSILRQEIETQDANTPILSERELEKKYAVSRMTVRKAIELLVEEGILYRIQNIGTFVADQKLHKKVITQQGIEIFSDDKEYKIIYFNIKLSDQEIVKKLDIREEDLVVQISRLNFSDGEPESLDEIYIARHMINKNGMLDVREILKLSAAINHGAIHQVFVPMVVPIQYSNLLKVDIGVAIVRIDSTIHTREGKIYAVVKSYINPKKKKIEMTL
ncbi:MAG: GntR family transcriptional regulator [Anaerorhabdus sp.]